MRDQPISILIPTGALGAGIDAQDIARGIRSGVDAIACDAGSTDSGAAYLSTAMSKVSRESIQHDLSILIPSASAAGIPLLIGSCGTSGTDRGVDWTCDVAMSVAKANGIRPTIARLYSEQDPSLIHEQLNEQLIHALPPSADLTHEAIDSCRHIVALMGVEPYIDALNQGADIILGGRTTDTAVIAALPIMKGVAPNLAWHAAKIAECGGLCCTNPLDGGVIVRFYDDSFTVEPLREANRATPQTVSAHMLYENSDPFRLIEPGGVLDVSSARYRAVNDSITRVDGSTWTTQPYTMKLEGAGGGEFQTVMLIGIRDPKILNSLEMFKERLLRDLEQRVITAIGLTAADFQLSLRLYGWNAVSGEKVPENVPAPREVGALLVITSSSQALSTRIAKTCNPYFFHFPLAATDELPTYAYPFSPAEIERGEVHAFHLNHVIETEIPLSLSRLSFAQY